MAFIVGSRGIPADEDLADFTEQAARVVGDINAKSRFQPTSHLAILGAAAEAGILFMPGVERLKAELDRVRTWPTPACSYGTDPVIITTYEVLARATWDSKVKNAAQLEVAMSAITLACEAAANLAESHLEADQMITLRERVNRLQSSTAPVIYNVVSTKVQDDVSWNNLKKFSSEILLYLE